MIECTTTDMPAYIKSHRVNVVGFTKDESPNYAGKERVNSGICGGGWTVTTYVGDRKVSDTMEYLKI